MGSAGDRRGKAGETGGGEKERGGSLGEDRGGCWVMKEIMTRERERKRERPAFFASPPGAEAGTSTPRSKTRTFLWIESPSLRQRTLQLNL